MSRQFRIPKKTDREIITALGNIIQKTGGESGFRIRVSPPFSGSHLEFHVSQIEENPHLTFLLEEESRIIDTFYIIDLNGGHAAITINRAPSEISDSLTINEAWANQHRSSEEGQRAIVRMMSLSQKELDTSSLEHTFSGTEDSEWNRYRRSQASSLKTLTENAQRLIVTTAQTNAELDEKRSQKFNELEADLREELQHERTVLNQSIEEKLKVLEDREKSISEREAGFETKESHYVARKQREAQIKEVNAWLKEFEVTDGTKTKRRPIFWIYIVTMLLTGGMTIYSLVHSYDLLGSVEAASKLQWWQWVGISLKVVVPFAVFTSFVIYFIRWTSSWARLHTEGEFKNRNLLIDIGRSSWLLEAVRDAQERKSEIPPELLKELSRNLFSETAGTEAEIHPTAVSDILLQGLQSLRIKTPDGSEIEANRSK